MPSSFILPTIWLLIPRDILLPSLLGMSAPFFIALGIIHIRSIFPIFPQMILFFGDVHGDVRHVLSTVVKHRPAAVIFLGDIEAAEPLEHVLAPVLALTEVWFIHGNHDSDSEQACQHVFSSALAARNLRGKVVEIAG